MDSFEWNKIVGAILGTLLFLFIVKEAAHITFSGEGPEKEMAYKIEIPETEAQQSGNAKPEPVDFGTLLQQANAEEGETVARRCLQCHTFEKGGPNKTGPNLWGVLGRDIASRPDFKYSNALSKLEGEWTYERIYEFVGAPSRYVPGTAMSFPGLRRQQERIDLLAFLRTKTDSPPPIPEPLPKAAEEDGAAPPGEGDQQGENAPDESGAAGAGTEQKASAAAAEGEDAGAGDTPGNGGESAAGDAADKAEGKNSPDDKDPDGADGAETEGGNGAS